VQSISSLRCALDSAQQEATLARHAAWLANARLREADRALRYVQCFYTEALHLYVNRRRPEVMAAWSYAQSAVENANLRATALHQVLALNLGPTPGSVEPSPRLVDELHCFLGFAAEALRGLAKLSLVTGSGYRAVDEVLKSALTELETRGASALVSPDQAVADAANRWLECSVTLLRLATGLLQSELEFAAAALEEAQRQRTRDVQAWCDSRK